MSRLISICFCQSKRGILNLRLLKLNTPLFLSLPSSLPSPFPSFPHSFLPSFQTHWYYGFRKENSMSISLWFNFSDDIFFPPTFHLVARLRHALFIVTLFCFAVLFFIDSIKISLGFLISAGFSTKFLSWMILFHSIRLNKWYINYCWYLGFSKHITIENSRCIDLCSQFIQICSHIYGFHFFLVLSTPPTFHFE